MFDTIEDAQNEILRLQGLNAELEATRVSLNTELENVRADNERIRKTNQIYFEKLCAQDSSSSGGHNDEDQEPVSCEDFARTLKI